LDPRTDRAERVEALRARPLAVLLLQIACGDVADAGVAVDRIERLLALRPADRATDHDTELGLVLDALALLRQHDRLARSHDRRGRLQEQERLCRRLVAELLRVSGVVPPDADDLRRTYRRAKVRWG